MCTPRRISRVTRLYTQTLAEENCFGDFQEGRLRLAKLIPAFSGGWLPSRTLTEYNVESWHGTTTKITLRIPYLTAPYFHPQDSLDSQEVRVSPL